MVKLGVPNRTLKKWWPRTLRTSRADLISKADDPLPHQSTTNLLAIWLISPQRRRPPKTKTIINSRCLFGWSSLELGSQKRIYSHVFFFLDEVATLWLFPNIAGWKIPPFYVGNTILLATNVGGLSHQKSANHQVSIWLKFEIYRGLLMVEKTYKRRFLKTMTHPCWFPKCFCF